MTAQEIILNIVRGKVAVMNAVKETADGETMERFRHELTGMMVCLKNISLKNEFYCINYLANGFEFGYYDKSGKWYSIEKPETYDMDTTAEIELPDNIPGMVIESPVLPEVVIPKDFDI